MTFLNIIFHNEIKEISRSAFCGAVASSISFPSSLVTIGDTAFFNAKIDELCFENYKDSKLDNSSLCNLIRSMFQVFVTDGSSGSYVPDLPNSTKDGLIRFLMYKVIPILKQSLENDYYEQVIIKREELSMKFIKRIIGFFHEKSFTEVDCEWVFDKIKERGKKFSKNKKIRN